VLPPLGDFSRRFPSLSRRVYAYCRDIDNYSELLTLLDDVVVSSETITEDQRFRIAKIAEDF
jgi:hypothetical protein